MNEELKSKVERLEKELNEVKAEINKPVFVKGWNYFTGFGMGNWLTLNPKIIGSKLVSDSSIQLEDTVNWYEAGNFCEVDYIQSTRPATYDEIFNALKKVADNKGFKEGVKVDRSGISIVGPDNLSHRPVTISDNYFRYDESQDTLILGGFYIYYKGQWAKVITESELAIAGIEPEYHDTLVRYKASYFEKDFFVNLLSLKPGKRGFECEILGEKITIEKVVKILDGFNN